MTGRISLRARAALPALAMVAIAVASALMWAQPALAADSEVVGRLESSLTVSSSGTWGSNLTWSYDAGTKTLTISGEGAMADGDYNSPGWKAAGLGSVPFEHVVISEGITSVGGYDFYGCTQLTSVDIPSSVVSMGISAFNNCTSLASVDIPEGVTSISDFAFCNCTSLASVDIPEGVTSISYGVFSFCASLASVDIPEGVTSIDVSAFCNCTSLASVDIPEGVTSIGSYAFSGCSSLVSALIPSSVAYIGESVFSACTSLASVDIPEGVTSIGYREFRGCTSLTSVGIPSSVTAIGNDAFYNCSSLTSVSIPEGVTSLGYEAFWGCSSLVSACISEGVTSIDSYTFYGCTSLVSVAIPSSATSISYGAFSGCSSLADVYYAGSESEKGDISVSDGNECLTGATWRYCKGTWGVNLTWSYDAGTKTLIVSGEGAMKGMEVTTAGWEAYAGSVPFEHVIISEGVTAIESNAFYGCTSLVSVSVPSSVASVDGYAFADCTSLASVDIAEGVAVIGESAFVFCSSLGSVSIPSSVTSVGSKAFRGCSSLASFAVAPGSDSYRTETGRELVSSADVLVAYADGSGSSYVIPASVTSIGGSAFFGCTSLESVSIPSSVTSVGSEAFGYCSSLASAVISEGVASIGWYAFSHCESLASVRIPSSVTSMGMYAFDYCSSLASVDFAEGVASVGPGAFRGCAALTSVTIPSSVASIDSGAFRDCSSLASVDIPSSVTSIGSGAFSGCASLVSVDIPSSVTSVGSSVFSGCTSLESVFVSEGIASIGDWAFSGCSSLTSATIPASVSSIGYGSFDGCASLADVYYAGSESGRGDISIDLHNECLTDAAWHYLHVHRWYSENEYEPTCTEAGYVLRTCVYGESFREDATPSTGHSWGEWSYNGDATCEVDGTKTRACSRCGATETASDEGTATGHRWDGGVTTATCTEGGITTYTCENDPSHTYSEKAEALGHDVQLADAVEPTCTELGHTAGTRCTRCGTWFVGEAIPATGHRWDGGVVTTPATCETAGVITYTCANDPTHTYTEAIPALGGSHSWGAWEQTEAPTDKSDGAEERACSRCGATEERAVAAYRGIDAFVYRLYANVLGRTPDEGGFAAQIAGIKASGAAQITFNFYNSDEFKERSAAMSNEDIVENVYQTMLGRASDEGGKAMWVSYLDNGMSACALAAGFAESDEFRALCETYGVDAGSAGWLRANLLEPRDKNPGVTAFASRMYTVVLSRAAEVDGLNVQCQALINGTPCYQIAYNFFNSAEFAGHRYTSEQVVRIAYAALLGRDQAAIDKDKSGIAYWVKRLEANGLEDMVRGFCQSDEFEKICQDCGMTSGMR